MAIVTVPGLLSAKGKVGTNVFYNNGIRRNVRSYCKHTKTSTGPQQIQRAFFTDAKNAWKALSFPMVLQWNVWAHAAGWKKGAYQYFIHCYMRGIGPMPVDYHHLIIKKTFTPLELAGLLTADIELIPSPGPNKFILCRFFQCYIANSNFNVPSLNIYFQNEQLVFSPILGVFSPVNQFGPAIYVSSENNGCLFPNYGVFLTSGLNPVIDNVGSSNLNIQIEYSILDWLNA